MSVNASDLFLKVDGQAIACTSSKDFEVPGEKSPTLRTGKYHTITFEGIYEPVPKPSHEFKLALKTKGKILLQMVDDPSVSIEITDEPKAYKYFKEYNEGDVIKLTITL